MATDRTDKTTELAPIEKRAVDALLAAWARFADQTSFDGERLSVFARALQSMSWKIAGDIREIASAPASSIEAEERIRQTFVMAEVNVLAQPGLDANAFRAYLAKSEDDEEEEG